jgi:hypothetical protein
MTETGAPFPPIGSFWKENDPRAWGLRKEVVAHDLKRRRVQFNTRRWAKVERFNGKRGGYTQVCGVPGCQYEPGHIGAHKV